MQAYLRFYDSRRDVLLKNLFSSPAPELTRVLAMLSPERRVAGYTLQTRAITQGEWDPYLDYLSQWGEEYANAGVTFSAWLDFIRASRDVVIDQLAIMLAEDPGSIASVRAIMRGVTAASDVVVQAIGDAYLRALLAGPEERRREIEEQLRHAQKMEAVGRLAGGVAHDFNNMLTVVQTYACMLEASIDASDVRHQDASEIRRASERATALTRQLLTLSRHSVVAPKAVDLDDLVAGFLPMLRRLVGENVGIVAGRGDTPPVLADPGQLEQILMNLAVNARDAMPDGGHMTIETQVVEIDAETAALRGLAPGPYVELAVTDTGSGIDAEVQKRMFDPFFTTKGVGEGTGLGLSLVHGIVTDLGGAIDVATTAQGTRFEIWLPTAGEAAEPAIETVRELPRGGGQTVMIVDDERVLVALAEEMLAELGYEPVGFDSSSTAVQAFRAEPQRFDLILTDEAMPDLIGTELAREIRRLQPTVPVILMSGYGGAQLTERAASIGVREVLRKPLRRSDLAESLARVLGSVPAGVSNVIATQGV